MALTMLLHSSLAWVRLACFWAALSTGMSIAARMPMMAMTIRSSTMVNARATGLRGMIFIVGLRQRAVELHLVVPVADEIGFSGDDDFDPQVVGTGIVDAGILVAPGIGGVGAVLGIESGIGTGNGIKGRGRPGGKPRRRDDPGNNDGHAIAVRRDLARLKAAQEG